MTAPAFSGSFMQVDPEHVAEVGPAAAILFARIQWRAAREGSWRASRSLLSQETGLSAETVRTALQRLRDVDWIHGERASATDATMVWSLVSAGQPDSGDSPTSCGGFPHLEVGTFPISDVGDSPISSTKTDVKPPPTPQGERREEPALFGPPPGQEPAAEEDPLRGFDEWYTLYPRKVAKGDARKAWTQVLRAGALPEQILRGLRVQVKDLQEQHERGFCPYPASWLRAERWEDVPPAPDNVHHLRPAIPAPDETFDPAFLASLPPAPRSDMYGLFG